MNQSRNDGEVVVQARRSAKVINVIQKFIHDISLPFGQAGHMRDASIQIPYRSFIAEDFKDAVAEDQEAGAGWDSARLSWKMYTAQGTHYQAGGRKKDRICVGRE